MQHCKQCKFFSQWLKAGELGVCELADSNEDEGPVNPTTLAYAGGYRACLFVKQNFGCVQFQVKENQS